MVEKSAFLLLAPFCKMGTTWVRMMTVLCGHVDTQL
jgi:hypothetical protein